MAFLRFRSVYCILEKDLSMDRRFAFGAICISTATLSIYGACIQLKSWKGRLKDSESRRKPSSNPVIVFCLALADLFTCIGVIAMSILFITMNPPSELAVTSTAVAHYEDKILTFPNKTWYKYIGVPIESFTQFSYISSYLWTFGYALDICLQLYDKDTSIRMRAYYLCFWALPIWLVAWGQYGYLAGSMGICSIRTQEIWHFLVCFVPLVCVFIILPFIYILAYRQVQRNIKSAHACFTNAERELLFAVKKKFLLIWLVFAFCWITNVIDGIFDLQAVFDDNKNPYIEESSNSFSHANVHYGIWMLEALVNPLQGFLNCLVYGKAKKMAQCCRKCCQLPQSIGLFSEGYTSPSDPSENFLINSHDILERSPLLQESRDRSLYRTEESQDYNKQKPFVAKLLGEPRIT